MSKKIDIIQQVKKDVDTYNDFSENAVSIVTSTMETLKELNEDINAKIQNIETYQLELTSAKNGLESTKNKNERVISNFKSLLELN